MKNISIIKTSPSNSSPILGEVRRGMGEEDTTPNPSYPRRGTVNANAKILIIPLILLTTSLVALPPRADAFSECKSEKRGYCVRLDAQDAPKGITQKKSSFLFFAAAGAGAGAPFPGLEFLQTYGIGYDTKIGELLSALYNFGVVIAGISALIMFTYGGVRYVTSAGSTSAISDAKAKMRSALLGLALIVGSYLILYTINPDFTLTLSEDKIPSLNLKPKPPAPAPPAPPPEPPPVPI